jgi:tetratricopeptide (TPR) repeat protein
MLIHPVNSYIERYERASASDPVARLDALFMAFDYVLRVDTLLLAAALLEGGTYSDLTIWTQVLREHLTLGQWRRLLSSLMELAPAPAVEVFLSWHEVIGRDGTLDRLVALRNDRTHAEARAYGAQYVKWLSEAERRFSRLRDTHPVWGDFHEREDHHHVDLVQGGHRLSGGPFLLSGSIAGHKHEVLVYSGRKSNSLHFEGRGGITHSSHEALQEVVEHLRSKTPPDEYLPERFPPSVLNARLSFHTIQTLDRLIEQRMFRPECSIDRPDLETRLAPLLLDGRKRLILLQGAAESGKTTLLCQIAEARLAAGKGILLETADRLPAGRLPESLATLLRIRGNFSTALQSLGSLSADKRVLITLDGLEATGREEQYLLDLFQWTEQLPEGTCIRIIATLRAEQLLGFTADHATSIPTRYTEIITVTPLSERALIELAERLQAGAKDAPTWVFSARLEMAKRMAQNAYDSARYPGLAARILEAADRDPDGSLFSAHRICSDIFQHVANAVQRPMRGRILRLLASLVLARDRRDIDIENRALDQVQLVNLGTGKRSVDYQGLLAAHILTESLNRDEQMSYVSFTDQRFYEYVASLVLPLANVAQLLSNRDGYASDHRSRLSIAAFLLIRAVHANGATRAMDALEPLGPAKEQVLLEVARLEGDAFLDIIRQLAPKQATEALSLVALLLRTGEPRLAARATEVLMERYQASSDLLNRAHLIRAKACYEMDDHRSAEQELARIAGEPPYEVLALRAEIAIVRGELSLACELYRDLAAQTCGGPLERRVDALDGLGYVLGRLGRYCEAAGKLEEAIELLEPLGESLLLAEVFGDLGQVRMETGQIAGARELLYRNRSMCERLGSLIGQGVAESLIGELCKREGRQSEAEVHFRMALETARWVGNRWREAWIMMRMGELFKSSGRTAEGQKLQDEAGDLFERIGGVDL